MTGERCYCGDTECPSCGTAQGTRGTTASDRAYARAMERIDRNTAKRKHRHRAQRTRQAWACVDCGAEWEGALLDARPWPCIDHSVPRALDIAECSCGATRRTERGPWIAPAQAASEPTPAKRPRKQPCYCIEEDCPAPIHATPPGSPWGGAPVNGDEDER